MEMVNLETGESISNGVVSTCNMSYKDMYVILCCTEIKHTDESHHLRAVGGPFLPYVYYCLVVTMHQLSRQEMRGWGPLHDRQLCWKLHECLVHCPLLKLPHIVVPDVLRLGGLVCCELSRKDERGQLSGKWFLAPQ